MATVLGRLLASRFLALSTIEHNAIRSHKRPAQRNRHFTKRPPPLPCPKYQALEQSLKQKGYLRAQNPYSPPQGVCKTVLQLKATANCATGSFDNEFNLGDKFKFLSLCSTEFNHTVPNSVLHEINTYDDVIAFYETPVDTILPLDEMRKQTLPPNLHIQHEYIRFDPSPDGFFKGQTAFPHRSTIHTGIKAKAKYKNIIYEPRWSRL